MFHWEEEQIKLDAAWKKNKEEINGVENDNSFWKWLKKLKIEKNNLINQLSNKSLKIKRRLTPSKIERK